MTDSMDNGIPCPHCFAMPGTDHVCFEHRALIFDKVTHAMFMHEECNGARLHAIQGTKAYWEEFARIAIQAYEEFN
jgi:hypothetical protein